MLRTRRERRHLMRCRVQDIMTARHLVRENDEQRVFSIFLGGTVGFDDTDVKRAIRWLHAARGLDFSHPIEYDQAERALRRQHILVFLKRVKIG